MSLRIAFMMLRHRRESPIFPEVIARLAQRNVHVDVVYPEEQVFDLGKVRVEHDLYVLKAKSEFSLSVAAALHSAGANIVNPYPVSLALRDKVAASQILLASGVPHPATFTTTDHLLLTSLLDDGPLVVKPYRGSQGEGVRVVWTADDLASSATKGEIVFAQRYHVPQGTDRKMYRIGDRVFGVSRVWPPRTLEDKLGKEFAVSPEIEEITRRCGDAFGIDLYGVDIIESDGKPYVVDMSSLPGFKGVPNAAALLADHFYNAAMRPVLSGMNFAHAATSSAPPAGVRL